MISDATHHACQKVYGKCTHISIDSMGNAYCAYCQKPLLISQVDDTHYSAIKKKQESRR